MLEIGSLIIFDEKEFTPGIPQKLYSEETNGNCVVFEDDGKYGFFHAFEWEPGLRKLDTLLIYTVKDFHETGIKSVLKVLWTEDGTKAFLSINNFCHAVIDFKRKAGYCRLGLPRNLNGWTLNEDRVLTDEMVIKLAYE